MPSSFSAKTCSAAGTVSAESVQCARDVLTACSPKPEPASETLPWDPHVHVPLVHESTSTVLGRNLRNHSSAYAVSDTGHVAFVSDAVIPWSVPF